MKGKIIVSLLSSTLIIGLGAELNHENTSFLNPLCVSVKADTVSGTFTSSGTNKIYTSASTSGTSIGSYNSGQKVSYDSKIKSGKYLWISWMSYGGQRHYMIEENLNTGHMHGTDTNSSMTTNVKKTNTKHSTGKKKTTSSVGKKIISLARAEIGKPYKTGATGPNSFDCSGLTQFIYNKVGISIPRTSQQQSLVGKYVSLSNLVPGDLVFWGAPGTSGHVGIYTGNGKCLFAPQPGQTVKEQPMSYYSPQFGRHIF
ncbi:NlpC/P60 family protein [Pediococcus argentinicus]|uniref:NlpC/P60 domain-containing protein n=1 Tax=Pediococcus argentinicus TaxID=480391 RepID=A0A0R2N595_9LACO|nr:C40 family peptidase [Pediococcus argentinicus]KRO20881.1 hypothetical protein IV88_GL001483 [Pediococcus argentinicus]NKZ23162.1 C40 family peptidase [Pediococcus argentinicus]GEP20352.1 hypothetical protein LSA03_17360 [Pediococcus argentinicus]